MAPVLAIGSEHEIVSRRFVGPTRVRLLWPIKGTACWAAHYLKDDGTWSVNECFVHENEITKSF